MKQIFLFSLLMAIILIQPGLAQIPKTMSYQGVLTNAGGAALPDGVYKLSFSIYNTDIGGLALWSETYNSVAVVNGGFNIILGTITPLTLPFDQQYWLGMTVADGAELMPRMKLASAAYSLNAASVADNAVTSSKIADAAVTNDKIDYNAVTTDRILNGTISFDDIGQNGAGLWQIIKWDGSKWVPADDKIGSIDGGGTAGYIPVFISPTTLGNSVIFQTGGNVGIGTAIPQQKLHVSGVSRFDLGTGNINITTPGGWPGIIVYTQNGNRRDLTFDNDGLYIGANSSSSPPPSLNGIRIWENGDVSLPQTLNVNNINITGAVSGNKGPNNGAPFPRPAYDSGWRAINKDSSIILTHNIGGNTDNYVVDLQFKGDPLDFVNATHQAAYGGDDGWGALWYGLTSQQIKVYRSYADNWVTSVRVRIWVYN